MWPKTELDRRHLKPAEALLLSPIDLSLDCAVNVDLVIRDKGKAFMAILEGGEDSPGASRGASIVPSMPEAPAEGSSAPKRGQPLSSEVQSAEMDRDGMIIRKTKKALLERQNRAK